MNLREGTRRLALLLGLVGVIGCGLLSYAQLQGTMRQRADHVRFEQLANSPVVRRELKARQNDPYAPYADLPAGATVVPTPDFIPDDPHQPSILNAGGIKTVRWTESYSVASIETQDGETLYPTPAPGAWSYVLIAILPLLGFLIPWGTVRAIGWVLAGFFQPTKYSADATEELQKGGTS